jgi:hypothetical protein
MFSAKLCVECGREIVGERPVVNIAGFTHRRDYYHARCARRVIRFIRDLLERKLV